MAIEGKEVQGATSSHYNESLRYRVYSQRTALLEWSFHTFLKTISTQ